MEKFKYLESRKESKFFIFALYFKKILRNATILLLHGLKLNIFRERKNELKTRCQYENPSLACEIYAGKCMQRDNI